MGVVQRAALAFVGMSPDYRAAAGWIRSIWQADAEQYQRMMLDRLNHHLRSFAERGMLKQPEGVELPLDSLSGLAQIPSTTRQDLREMFPQLRSRYAGDKSVAFFETGGTTAEPVHLYRLKTTSGAEVASTRLMLEMLGWRPGMVRVGLWGSNRDLGLAEYTHGFKSVLNRALTLVHLKGSYRATDETYLEFLDTLKRYPGCAVYGFSCMFTDCARLMLRRGLELKAGEIAAMWTTAETVTPEVRSLIRQAFSIEPGDFYGARECPAITATCPHGRQHVNPRYIIESISAQGGSRAMGEEGELAITDLFNTVTPLLRYRLGDLGRPEWQSCACGRNGAVLAEFGGRVSEQIPLKSGTLRSTIWFPHTMRYDEVERAQIVKTGEHEFEIRYRGSQLKPQDAAKVEEVLSGMLEGARVTARLVGELGRTTQGKTPLFIDESC